MNTTLENPELSTPNSTPVQDSPEPLAAPPAAPPSTGPAALREAVPANHAGGAAAVVQEPAIATTHKTRQIAISSILGSVDTLSEAEQIDLLTCEAILETSEQSFVEKGRALAQIRDDRLYRGGEFNGFEEYYRKRWQYGRHYVNRSLRPRFTPSW